MSATPRPVPSRGLVTSRYPDGLPSAIDGEPALRASEAIVRARVRGGSDRFLVAGLVRLLGVRREEEFVVLPSIPDDGVWPVRGAAWPEWP